MVARRRPGLLPRSSRRRSSLAAPAVLRWPLASFTHPVHPLRITVLPSCGACSICLPVAGPPSAPRAGSSAV